MTELYIEFKNKCGIYIIKCNSNNKVYVGSSCNIYKRMWQHFRHLSENKHCNKRLQSSFNKYGIKSFSTDIIEECVINNLKTREKFYLDKYDSYKNGFNGTPVVEKGNIGFKHSEETKNKISLNNARYWKSKRLPEHVYKASSIASSKKKTGTKRSQNICLKISSTLMGHYVSNETRNKISQKLKGKNVGIKFSDEHKKKISLSNKGRKLTEIQKKRLSNVAIPFLKGKNHTCASPVIQYDKNMNEIQRFSTILDASNKTKINNISSACNGKRRKSAGGFIWMRLNNKNIL